jgi:MFS family permease
MPDPQPAKDERQSARFLYLYTLAVAGGAVAYVPFLTILLPIKVSTFAGTDALSVLAYAAFAGAIAASIANVGFGWISDVSRSRRSWIWAGMILSSALLVAMQYTTNAISLIVMIVCWQIFLNMMLAPLGAWAGDCVPDTQKGLLGGLLAVAPALGALSGALVTMQGLATADQRLMLIAVLVVVMVLPVLLLGKPAAMPQLMKTGSDKYSGDTKNAAGSSTVLRMWTARLMVQIAEASLFAFLLLWFRSIEPSFGENDAATIFAIVLGLAVVAAIATGRWSDRSNRPIFPLAVCAAIAAAGLILMAVAGSLIAAILGYAIFGLFSSVFLALHSSQTLRVLPDPQKRGRYLGLFNLTNTVPSLIMPWLVLALVPVYGFGALFVLLAGLAVVASILLTTTILERR